MARKQKDIAMPDMETATTAGENGKKRRKAQGPRKPSPLYAFVKVVDGKASLATSFRDPRKMAEYFPTATANGEDLLIISPEA